MHHRVPRNMVVATGKSAIAGRGAPKHAIRIRKATIAQLASSRNVVDNMAELDGRIEQVDLDLEKMQQ